jgi:hypothetical protein
MRTVSMWTEVASKGAAMHTLRVEDSGDDDDDDEHAST